MSETLTLFDVFQSIASRIAPVDVSTLSRYSEDLNRALRSGDRREAVATVQAALMLEEGVSEDWARRRAGLLVSDHELKSGPIRSVRKPHNHLAGYVCERKHPLQGHVVVFEASKAGIDFGCDESGKPYRWGVTWEEAPAFGDEGGTAGRIGPGFSSQRAARAFMKHETSPGMADYDWGGIYSDGSEV